MKKTIVDSWQIEDARQERIIEEICGNELIFDPIFCNILPLDADNEDENNYKTITITPSEKHILMDGEVMGQSQWDAMPETDPTRYQRLKQELIRESRFYEAPKEEAPDSFDSDWD